MLNKDSIKVCWNLEGFQQFLFCLLEVNLMWSCGELWKKNEVVESCGKLWKKNRVVESCGRLW